MATATNDFCVRKPMLDEDLLAISDYQSVKSRQSLYEAFLCIARDAELEENHDRIQLYIPLLDDLTDDILPVLHKAFSFLDHQLHVHRRKTVVYCMQGVSRSVALVCAYFMKIRKSIFLPVYKEIKKEYRQANISENFQEQLERFGTVFGWNMNLDSVHHRQYWDIRNRTVMRSVVMESPARLDSEKVYSCQKCRQPLFYESNLHPVHESVQTCTVLATERMNWMGECAEEYGKLLCPSCKAKLGSWCWHGNKCPHGQWISPAFFIHRFKID